jgi:hypothetical protein
MINPFIFSATHQELNMTMYFFGIAHAWTYEKLPIYLINQLERCDVLFHEGRHGVVFVEPFKTNRALREDSNLNSYGWLDKLTEEEKSVTQQIVNHYFKHVKREHINIPSIDKIAFWAIYELVEHFEYFATGNEVDYTIHNKFLDSGKKVIDLDNDFLNNRLRRLLVKEQENIYLLTPNLPPPYIGLPFKRHLVSINNFFKTNTYDFDKCEDLCDIQSLVEFSNDFSRESSMYVIDRNIKWIEKIYAFISKHQDRYKNRHLNLGVMCGMAHLPDLFARLISKGFEIKDISKPELELPLPERTKQMIFGFQVEKRAFEFIKSSIVSPSSPKELLNEIAAEEEFKQYVAMHGGNKRVAGALILKR